MSVFVEKAGLLTTVQDLGRDHYRSLGINPGGVMDQAAARIANILVGNDENEAVLEMHFPAASLLFESDAIIAVAGAEFGTEVDGDPLSNWSSHAVRKGQRLRFPKKGMGACVYLAVQGGLDIESWLGSRATNLSAQVGGFDGRPLKAGDKIEVIRTEGPPSLAGLHASPSLTPRYSSFPTVRVVTGAEFEELSSNGMQVFLNETFSVSPNSNRMGFRLEGPLVERISRAEVISSAVSFGTIQLLPDGRIIVLMADHQTTGGYPRIAHVISRDLPLVAQLGSGDKIAFHLIEIDQAEHLAEEFERELNFFKAGCRLLARS